MKEEKRLVKMELSNQFYEELKEKIQPYFEKEGSHSFNHTQRVYNLSLKLAKEEKNVDLDIIKTSALLHDIARKEQDEVKGELCHAERGVEIAEEILKEMNFPKEKIKNVCHVIEVHRYSKALNAKIKEAQVIQDADRLDALGAITIARIFDYAARENRPMHNPLIKPKEYVHNSESKSSIIHFYEKILNIKPETFHTQKAKEIAKGRYEFVKEFVDRFIKEWEGEL